MRISPVSSFRFLSFLLVLATVLFALPGFAADVTAQLSGTVKDSTGAIVSNAKVTLTNAQTNVSRTTTTSPDGNYLFTLVPVGNYQIAVEHPGFRKYVQSGIVLEVNQNARIDMALQLGEVSQTVEVVANAAQVDTVGATLGAVETTQRIVDLPLVGRDTFQLGTLQAGVYPLDESDGSVSSFSVSGQRSASV